MLNQDALLLKEGPNFRAEIVEGIATLRVWKREDLSLIEGAQRAEMSLETMALNNEMTTGQMGGLLMDFAEASQ